MISTLQFHLLPIFIDTFNTSIIMSLWKSPLTKVAVFGGVFVLGATTWMERRLQSNFKRQDYYQRALLLLHNYEPAAQVLGRPIYGGRVSLGDESKFKVELVKAKLTIPLKGSKGNGALHVLASREKLGDKWNIDQLDLEVFNSQQRWKFYDRERSTQEPQQLPSTDKTNLTTNL